MANTATNARWLLFDAAELELLREKLPVDDTLTATDLRGQIGGELARRRVAQREAQAALSEGYYHVDGHGLMVGPYPDTGSMESEGIGTDTEEES